MSEKPAPTPRRKRRRLVAASLTAALFLGGGVYVDPTYEPPEVEEKIEPGERMPNHLRILTLNAAHGRGTSFHQALTRKAHIRQNLDAVARVIQASDADVVALQELDAPSIWSGRFDHLEYLAAKTGYTYRYHGLHVSRGTPRLEYGTGILSRYPIRSGSSRAFGTNAFDTKGYVLVRVETPRGVMEIVSVHLDFKRSSERRAQLELLAADLAERPDPSAHLVVAGDFNCRVDDGPLKWFASSQQLAAAREAGPTFPSKKPNRRIDFILLSSTLVRRQQRVLPVLVSDHMPVLAEVRVR